MNTKVLCRSCQQETEFVNNTCLVCGFDESLNTDTSKKSIAIKSAVRPKIQTQVELGITVDRTGSSSVFKDGIPETLNIILQQLSVKAKNIKVWLRSHGDLDDGQESILLTDDGTPEQAMQDVKKISYGGGGDQAETHLDGIETLFQSVPWSLDPRKSRGAIIMFASSESKPARSGITPKQLGEAIRNKGLLLYLVCEPTHELKEMAEGASGLMFQISNAPKVEELQVIAAQVAASIVASMQSGGTVPLSVFGNLK